MADSPMLVRSFTYHIANWVSQMVRFFVVKLIYLDSNLRFNVNVTYLR
jgi:hypothetical protein